MRMSISMQLIRTLSGTWKLAGIGCLHVFRLEMVGGGISMGHLSSEFRNFYMALH